MQIPQEIQSNVKYRNNFISKLVTN